MLDTFYGNIYGRIFDNVIAKWALSVQQFFLGKPISKVAIIVAFISLF